MPLQSALIHRHPIASPVAHIARALRVARPSVLDAMHARATSTAAALALPTPRARRAAPRVAAARASSSSIARVRAASRVPRPAPGPRARDGRDAVVARGLFGGDDDGGAATARVSTDAVMIDPVVGAKRFSNYFWAGVVTAGSTGFLLTGASAYLHHNLVFFLDATDIKFFPQGLVMSFYGVAGAMLATYLWLTISWDVGAGYNEFNKDEGIMRIFRYGFPGKNRRVNLVSDLADVQAVRVEISEGVNPRRVVYVRCKGKRDIPLTRIGQPLTLAEVEQRAADLAKFLQVPIEGL